MKILLADDSALLRAGLAGILRASGHEVVEVSDAEELVDRCKEVTLDLVVSDVRMPPRMENDGLEAVHRLRAEHLASTETSLPVVILSQYVAAAYLDTLLDHGGFGYLLKERVVDVEEFLGALETVAAGGTVVDPDVVKALLRNRTTKIDALTEREREVLALMAEGLSNTEICGKLFLSPGAVSKHVANVFMKLGFTPDDDNRRVRAMLEWLRYRAV